MSIIRSIVLGTLLAAPMVSGASVVESSQPGLGSLGNATFGHALSAGDFLDSYTFNVPAASTLVSSITNYSFQINQVSYNDISNFGAYIDAPGNAFSYNAFGNVQVLSTSIAPFSAGDHKLFVTGSAGINGASYGGNIAVAPVPVPAAVWLMSSAILGLVSFGRRKIALPA